MDDEPPSAPPGSHSAADTTVKFLADMVTAAPRDGALETMSGAGGLTQAGALIEVLNSLRFRLAQVRVHGRQRGTGVLVGHNFILTAGHVIEQEAGEAAAADSIEAVFAFSYQPGRAYGETVQSVRAAGVILYSPPTDAERCGIATWQDDIPDERGDYAILELVADAPDASLEGEPIAREYYRINFDPYEFHVSETLFIGHFPLGLVASISPAQSAQLHPSGRRIRYDTDTICGSSGGPMVNTSGRLVAIHHYGATTHNRGVPVDAVARGLQSKGLDYLFSQPPEENVRHLGRYSLKARDQICHAIDSDWQTVAERVPVPDFITGSYAVWNWLSSHHQLRKLRDALMEADYPELVTILDHDVVIVDPDTVDRLEDLTSQLRQCAATSELPSTYHEGVTKARLLSGSLLRDVEMLLAVPDDTRARLQWRREWRGTLSHAASQLGKLLKSLPQSQAEAGYNRFVVAECARLSEAVHSAVSTLRELARNPALYD